MRVILATVVLFAILYTTQEQWMPKPTGKKDIVTEKPVEVKQEPLYIITPIKD